MRRSRAISSRALWAALSIAIAAAIGLVLLILARQSPPPQVASAPAIVKPALWRIADSDTTIYFFGTIHALPRDVAWRTPAIERAIDASDELVMEIADSDSIDELSLFGAMARDDAPAEPIAARIDRQLLPAYDRAIEQARMSRSQIDGFEDWAAALVIGNMLGASAGFDPARGIEPALDARFRASGKPVSGLETTAGQLGIFDALPRATQAALLVKTITGAKRGPAQAAAIARAWENGDIATIDRLVSADLRSVDGLAGPLLDRRNARWADQLERRLAQPGTVFVAVGVAHLAGARSVQARLADRTGLTVERIR
jgi:hypothetical protein